MKRRSGEMKIGSAVAKPGSAAKGYFNGGYMPDGQEVRVPVFIANGAKEGPALWVQAAIHGYEFEGTLAIHEIIRRVRPAELSGRLVLVPALNIPSFITRERFSWLDEQDMNRQFPGSPDGSYTQQLAHKLLDLVAEHCDYAADMHSGGWHGQVGTWVIYAGKEEGLELAKKWGHKVLFTPKEGELKGRTFYSACAERGVPALLTEYGGLGTPWAETVASNARGIWNLLQGLGMVPGKPELPASYQHVTDWVQIYSHRGGLFLPEVKVDDVVKNGQKLGRIVDLFGDTVEEIQSRDDGVMVGIVQNPVVSSGERVMQIGRF